MKTPNRLLALTAVVVGLQALSASAAVIVVNDNSAGSTNERGIAFDLTNTSTTESVQLTGLFNLAVVTALSEGFNLWIRTGTVLNNVGAGATGWTNFGSITEIGQAYASPSFTLTSYNFTAAAGYTIAPGETIGIWLKDTNATASYRYISGGSSTVLATDGFTDGGLRYNGFYGLGTTGASPDVANQLFGPTRNFIGEVGYTVVPEPSTWALLMAGLLLALIVRRRLAA